MGIWEVQLQMFFFPGALALSQDTNAWISMTRGVFKQAWSEKIGLILGVWQKVTKKVTEASEKVTEKWPKASRKRKKVIELLLPHSFCGTLKAWSEKIGLIFVPYSRRCACSDCIRFSSQMLELHSPTTPAMRSYNWWHDRVQPVRNFSTSRTGCRAHGSQRGFRESLLDPSWFRTRWIGANPEKSDLVNFRGPD